MDQVPIELKSILHEIEKALDAKLYYLAIAVALSIPDICACLEFDPDKPAWADRKTYTAWCSRNLAGKFKVLTGDDLYNIRGGVVHKGRLEHQKLRFDRVMFIGPESAFQPMGDIIVNVKRDIEFSGIPVDSMRLGGDILNVGVVFFCKTIMDAAKEWVIANGNNEIVQKNLRNLIRYRPEGFTPFSKGVPTVT